MTNLRRWGRHQIINKLNDPTSCEKKELMVTIKRRELEELSPSRGMARVLVCIPHDPYKLPLCVTVSNRSQDFSTLISNEGGGQAQHKST